MKKRSIILSLIFSITLVPNLWAQENDYNNMANKILKQSMNVQPGEVIQIVGGVHKADIMEAFFIEAAKLKALPNMRITTDETMKAFYGNLCNENQDHWDSYFKNIMEETDYWIFLNKSKNIKAIFKDFTKEQNKEVKIQGDNFNLALMSSENKAVYLFDFNPAYSTYEETRNESFKKMYMDAVNADYIKISENAKKLKTLLSKSEKVELSTARGTKLSFSVKDRGFDFRDGVLDEEEKKSGNFSKRYIAFPTGYITVGVNETTANGNLFVPKDFVTGNNILIENISFKVKNGKMLKVKADKNLDPFLENYAKNKGDMDMIASLRIGLNPGFVADGDNVDFNNYNAAGIVSVVFGDNTKFGGNNQVEKKRTYFFILAGTTLKVDGKLVIKEGKLMLD